MNDRGMIKWAPFNSVISGNIILNDLKNERDKVLAPSLSNDQLNDLNNKLLNNYHLQNEVIITYYFNNKINLVKGKINKIHEQKKEIFINNIILHTSMIISIDI